MHTKGAKMVGQLWAGSEVLLLLLLAVLLALLATRRHRIPTGTR